MAITGSVTFKVTPEELISKAQTVQSLGNKIQNDFMKIEDVMNKTSRYWIGEAGEAHRKKYNDQKEDIHRMMIRLLEHPDDLLRISGNYTTAEETNVNTAQGLPSDIF